jgi:TolA-binding protein
VKNLTLTALLLAALAAGCGADEESQPTIPADTATALQNQLNSIQQRFEFPGGQACGDITAGTDPNTTPVETLVASVRDAEMRSALEDSFNRLFELVERECAQIQQEQSDTTDTTETQTTETTTETTTDTTETQPPTTDTTETVPPPTDTIPTETLPPDGVGDGGGGGFGPGEG